MALSWQQHVDRRLLHAHTLAPRHPTPVAHGQFQALLLSRHALLLLLLRPALLLLLLLLRPALLLLLLSRAALLLLQAWTPPGRRLSSLMLLTRTPQSAL